MRDVESHLAATRKKSKDVVGYEHPAKGAERCGTCRHFEVSGKNLCEIVAGKILSEDWCREWEEK
jgi:hypothetical protein